jgi:hypothetical protein
MDEREKGYDAIATMTHEDILNRFQRLFGREMTAAERREFFLPHRYAPTQEQEQ